MVKMDTIWQYLKKFKGACYESWFAKEDSPRKM